MRVLMLNHNLARAGGTYFRAFHLGRQLAALGHRVTLVTVSPKRRARGLETIEEGVRVWESPDLLWGRGRTGWDPWDSLWRILALRHGAFDLVHAFDSRPAVVLPALALRRRKLPLVMDWADWWGRGGTQAERPGRLGRLLYGPLETWFEETFRTRAQATTVISAALRERALALGVRASTIRLLPGGCNPDAIRPADGGEGRLRLGLAPSEFVVGYMGAAAPADVEILAGGFARLLGAVPQSRLLVLGAAIAGSRRPFADSLPAEVRGRLLDAGRVPFRELSPLLAACDVFALPLKDSLANRARWPSRIGDYLAAGRPVVSTSVSDARHLFRNDIGILCGADPAAFAAALIAIRERPDKALAMGANARRLAEGPLSWRTLAGQAESLYEEVLSARPDPDRQPNSGLPRHPVPR